MKIEKGKIEQGDEVYASLSIAGKVIAELKETDAEKMDDILHKLRTLALRYSGMTRVYIRNHTKGWSLQLPLMLCKSLFALRTRDSLVAEGICDRDGQLLIPFGTTA